MAAYTREKQIKRKYGPQPSLSEQATVGDDDFVDPYRSSNSVLGYTDAAPENRPANFVSPAKVTAVTPSAQPLAGRVVTVTGKYFTSATGVTFGGTAGTAFSVINDTTIQVTSPAKSAGTYDVVVVKAAGNGTLTGGVTYA